MIREASVKLNEANVAGTTATVINNSDDVGAGVIIGDVYANGNALSGATGVLVLEASDKVLILLKVAVPHTVIASLLAGRTICCYDTDSNSLAVFEGKVWNYWK